MGEVRQVFAEGLDSEDADSSTPLRDGADHRLHGVINALRLPGSWDVVQRWFGRPRRVLAWGKTFTPQRPDGPNGALITVEIPEAMTVIAEIPAGPVITCIQSGVARFGQDRIEIFGEKGTLIYSGSTGSAGRGDLMGAHFDQKELGPLPIPDDVPESPQPEEEFVRLIRGAITAPTYSFEMALQTAEFLEAAHQSAMDERWVELPQWAIDSK